jgi:high-affinity iron transporter
MVGEEVNEMQLAGWVATTNIPWLQGVPPWAELWFSIFPNVQTFVGQGLAIAIVGGSYFFTRIRMWRMIQNSRGPVLGTSQS